MNRLYYPNYKISSYLIVAVTYATYVAAFAYYYEQVGMEIASLAILPVITTSWYFGIKGGLLLAFMAILSNTVTLISYQHSLSGLLRNPGHLIGSFSLLLIAFIFGRMSTLVHERRADLIRLEQNEQDRGSHTVFLEKLNEIIARALEADSLQATLEILTGQLAGLFQADDVYLSLWDNTLEAPIPAVAYGSMSEVFPHL